MIGQKGLGKGLGALLGETAHAAQDPAQPVRLIPLQKAEPNPDQPRKAFDPEELEALAQSIRENGVLQPLAVRETEPGRYQIIAGERRWRAARLAGLDEIPVLVVQADDKKAMELAMIENLQRQDLNPMEEAQGYRDLMKDYGMTQEEVADCVQKSRPAVANTLRLLQLSKPLQEMVSDGTLTPGHARAVLILSSDKQRVAAAQKIAALQLSVRQAELMCRAMAREKEPKKEKPLQVDYVAECEKSLSRKLGRGVKILCGKRKGRCMLEFYGTEDLEVLLEALQKLPAKEKKEK